MIAVRRPEVECSLRVGLKRRAMRHLLGSTAVTIITSD